LSEVILPTDTSLECSALLFLRSIVPKETCRSEITGNKPFVDTALAVALADGPFEFRCEVGRFFANVAPFACAEGGVLSAEKLGDVFSQVLSPSSSTSTSPQHKLYMLQSIAVNVLEVIFETVSPDLQGTIARNVSNRFVETVKSYTVTRAPGSADERSQGAVLACSLSTLLLLAVGKEATKDVFSSELVTSMIRLVEWRCDPKAGSEEKDNLDWDASMCHRLQILAFIFTSTRERLDKAGIRPTELSKTVLMMTRPGRAPRKAIDFGSALGKIVEDARDATSCIAARRILSRLDEFSYA
jgi:hypothetical protein